MLNGDSDAQISSEAVWPPRLFGIVNTAGFKDRIV